jgi:hypothetical protein
MRNNNSLFRVALIKTFILIFIMLSHRLDLRYSAASRKKAVGCKTRFDLPHGQTHSVLFAAPLRRVHALFIECNDWRQHSVQSSVEPQLAPRKRTLLESWCTLNCSRNNHFFVELAGGTVLTMHFILSVLLCSCI